MKNARQVKKKLLATLALMLVSALVFMCCACAAQPDRRAVAEGGCSGCGTACALCAGCSCVACALCSFAGANYLTDGSFSGSESVPEYIGE